MVQNGLIWAQNKTKYENGQNSPKHCWANNQIFEYIIIFWTNIFICKNIRWFFLDQIYSPTALHGPRAIGLFWQWFRQTFKKFIHQDYQKFLWKPLNMSFKTISICTYHLFVGILYFLSHFYGINAGFWGFHYKGMVE